MIDWVKIRSQFPALKNYTYLVTAGGAILPEKVGAAGKRFYDENVNGGEVYWNEWLKRVEEVRVKTAQFLQSSPEEIAFLSSASQAMGYLALMFKGQGDVITFDDEFPSTTIPWLHAGFNVDFIKPQPDKTYSLEMIKDKITNSTKFLVISHVQSNTGFRINLEEAAEYCKANNLIFIVNATQSAGAFPLDVSKIQPYFLLFQGYKWMLSGYGIAVLYINKKWFGKIAYPIAGSRSVEDIYQDNKSSKFKTNAPALEVGVPQFPNIFTLGAALDFISVIGVENIRDRIFELNNYLEQKLSELNVKIISPLNKQNRSGITCLEVNNPSAIAEKLRNENILITARSSFIRISLHFYNNFEDIDKFISTFKSFQA